MRREFILRFFRYAFVGLTGLVVNLLFLYFLTDLVGIYYLYSSIASFLIATLSNFVFNKVWTFKEGFRGKFLPKSLKFFTVGIFSLGINTLVLYFLTEIIGVYYLFSQVFAAGFTLISNFLGNNFWTFRKI